MVDETEETTVVIDGIEIETEIETIIARDTMMTRRTVMMVGESLMEAPTIAKTMM